MWLYFNNFIYKNSWETRFGPGTGHCLPIPTLENHTSLSIFGELTNFSLELMAITKEGN